MEEEFCFATPISSVGGKENVLCNTSLDTESRNCCKMCLEWENRSKKAEERCADLQLEIQKKNIDYELLQGRFGDLAGEKLAIEDNLRVLKKKNDELEERLTKIGRIVDLTEETDEEDKVFNLMIENKVLECEKKKAESELDIWKVKFKELESKVFELEERLLSRDDELNLTDKLMNENGDLGAPGNNEHSVALSKFEETPLIDTPCKDQTYVEGEKRETKVKNRKRIRKQLSFGQEESPKKKLAPSTPAVAIPASVGVVNIISDSDDSQESKNELVFDNNLKSCTLLDQNDEEDMCDYKWSSPFENTPRRKRASNIITSDSESSDDVDDDKLPICYLKTKRLPQSSSDPHLIDPSPSSTVSKRRVVTLRKLEGQISQERSSTNEDVVEDIQIEEDGSGSDSDDESLDGFIVDTTSSGDDVASSIGDESEEENVDYRDVISKIGRKSRNRVDNLKWEFEADMLADFGKDPELCMKAVCALYRQQTDEEKSNKLTIYSNQRGFSQCDAYRGSALAEFLTDGDREGDMVKNVEELREYDPKGVEICRKLATHYSKQLFAIYNNKEDPFFALMKMLVRIDGRSCK